MDKLVSIGAEDAPKTDAPNRIVLTFTDDHSIENMKVEVVNVTPEQVAIAIFHLTRIANQVADARQFQAAQAARELAAVAADLRRRS
jgi:hypothetical protein